MDDELIDESGPDDLDLALRRTLGRAAGPPQSVDGAWASLAPRLQRARRRHRAAIVGASFLVVAGLSAAVLSTNPLDSPGRVTVPAGPPDTSSNTRQTTTRPSSTATTATTATDPPSPAPAVDDNPVPGGEPGTEDTTTATAVPDETRSYVAPGGRATVRFAGGALTLVDFAANPGYTAEVAKAEDDDIEVRFRPASGQDSRIRVRVENGVVSPETE